MKVTAAEAAVTMMTTARTLTMMTTRTPRAGMIRVRKAARNNNSPRQEGGARGIPCGGLRLSTCRLAASGRALPCSLPASPPLRSIRKPRRPSRRCRPFSLRLCRRRRPRRHRHHGHGGTLLRASSVVAAAVVVVVVVVVCTAAAAAAVTLCSLRTMRCRSSRCTWAPSTAPTSGPRFKSFGPLQTPKARRWVELVRALAVELSSRFTPLCTQPLGGFFSCVACRRLGRLPRTAKRKERGGSRGATASSAIRAS